MKPSRAIEPVQITVLRAQANRKLTLLPYARVRNV